MNISNRLESRLARARGLLVYGALVAVLFAVAAGVAVPFPYTMQGGRIAQMRETTAALDRGAPPLLELVGGQYKPAGPTDDPGGFVLVPVLAHLTGTTNVVAVMKWCYVAAFALLVLVSPLVFGRLFGSWEAAGVAPWAMAAFGASVFSADVYWVGPWALAGLFPILLIVDARRTRRPVTLLALAMVAASAASAVRSQAGLPVLLTALAVIAIAREWSKRRRVFVAAACVACYLSITPLAMAGLRAYRDHWVGTPNFGHGAVSGHPFWHNAYIGLGYLPNKWQIRWHDAVANASVQRVRPGTAYLSHRYESILRRLWFNVVKDDPAFAVRQAAEKAVVVVKESAPYLLFLAAVAPWLWPRLRTRSRERRWALLLVPALVIPLVQPLLTVPYRPYVLHLFGGLGIASLLIISGVAPTALATARARPRLRLRTRATAVGIVSVVLVIALAVAGRQIDAKASKWLAQPAKPAPLP